MLFIPFSKYYFYKIWIFDVPYNHAQLNFILTHLCWILCITHLPLQIHSLMEAALPILLINLIILFCSLKICLLSLTPNLQKEKCWTSHVSKNLQSTWFLRYLNSLYPYGTALHLVSPAHQVALCRLWPHLYTTTWAKSRYTVYSINNYCIPNFGPPCIYIL